MGWLEGYQIRPWPRSWDNVPLFLLSGPHNELLLMTGCISSSSSARARLPRFLGSWALCPSQPPWLFLLDLE